MSLILLFVCVCAQRHAGLWVRRITCALQHAGRGWSSSSTLCEKGNMAFCLVEFKASWPVSIWAPCLCLPSCHGSFKVLDRHRYTWLYVGTGSLNSGPYMCSVNTLLMEWPHQSTSIILKMHSLITFYAPGAILNVEMVAASKTGRVLTE